MAARKVSLVFAQSRDDMASQAHGRRRIALSPDRKRSKGCSGFTLIELLVVIA
ncbi:MAG: type II secretion system protein, partial [Limisphaerales bacterium]